MRYVLYVNIGKLPHHKAIEYAKSHYEQIKTQFLTETDKCLVIAVRDRETELCTAEIEDNLFSKLEKIRATNFEEFKTAVNLL